MSKIKVNELAPYSSTGIGIGTSTPTPSAILDINSTTQGINIPRMTTVQRDAITSPSVGLQIYNLDTKSINTYNGTSWSGQDVSPTSTPTFEGLEFVSGGNRYKIDVSDGAFSVLKYTDGNWDYDNPIFRG